MRNLSVCPLQDEVHHQQLITFSIYSVFRVLFYHKYLSKYLPYTVVVSTTVPLRKQILQDGNRAERLETKYVILVLMSLVWGGLLGRGPELQVEFEAGLECLRFLNKVTYGIKVNNFSFSPFLVEKPVRIFMTIYLKILHFLWWKDSDWIRYYYVIWKSVLVDRGATLLQCLNRV